MLNTESILHMIHQENLIGAIEEDADASIDVIDVLDDLSNNPENIPDFASNSKSWEIYRGLKPEIRASIARDAAVTCKNQREIY